LAVLVARTPPLPHVEAALYTQINHYGWLKQLLTTLENTPARDYSAANISDGLREPSWGRRFMFRHALAKRGSKAIPELVKISQTGPAELIAEANWLLFSIGHETTARLRPQANRLICPDCLTRCGPHRLASPKVTYFGCRTCGQSLDFYHTPRGVTALLNNPDHHPQPAPLHDGALTINWLNRRELFDFDRVAIIHASDEMVERFAVQVGNDTDPLRREDYPTMACTVSPTCLLTENTFKILRRTFGRVTVEAVD
jgi:hypothetical protein